MLLAAPEHFNIASVTFDYESMKINITWDPPEKPNGIIIGYQLKISIVNQAEVQHQTWLSPNEKQYQYPVPVLCRNYVVQIASATAAAMAPFVSAEIKASSPGIGVNLSP